MELGFRLDGYFISANMAVLAAAGLFFAVMGWQALRSLPRGARFRLLCTAGLFGVAGAWLYGMAGFLTEPAPGGAAVLFELHFGSFGGFWGVLLGAALHAALTDPRQCLRYTDALTPALFAGGAIARVADLFTLASAGRDWTLPGTDMAPFTAWAVYDIAVLVALFMAVRSPRLEAWRDRPGTPLLVFLLGYGSLRFLLEFARLTQTPFGPFTWGQGMCAIQMLLGFVLLCRLARRVKA